MGRKNKISPEEKLKAVKEYLNNEGSHQTIATKYGVSKTPFQKWLAKYKSMGDAAFINSSNNCYSSEFKTQVTMSYLSGECSLQDIAVKFKIPSLDTVRQWVLKYNGHEELKASGTGGAPIMTKGRKTTYEERVEIVKYCIEHQNNYAETAQKYQVSYQQVYSWTTKYEKNGIEALLDKRGKRKPETEMSEIEKLKAKNKLLEAENKRRQMEIDFLKKLDEIERRRY
jgi:transposase-like protein